MGKKHKKQKAQWRSMAVTSAGSGAGAYNDYVDKPLEKPLKLVLKVRGSEVTELSGSGHDSSYYDDRSDHEREQHKEKKKKKKSEKHHDDEESWKRKEEKKRKREKELCDTEGETDGFDPGKKVDADPPPDCQAQPFRTQPDTTMGDKKKRKRFCLSIAQKVQLLQKLDSGVSVQRLREEYGVGKSTVYDLNKQKEQLLRFYAESDEQKLMGSRKSRYKAKSEDLDRVLKEWIRQRRGDHLPLNGMLIMKQAKIYHDELKMEGNCEYSTGWLQKFKKRHGIKFSKISDDEASGEARMAMRKMDANALSCFSKNISENCSTKSYEFQFSSA